MSGLVVLLCVFLVTVCGRGLVVCSHLDGLHIPTVFYHFVGSYLVKPLFHLVQKVHVCVRECVRVCASS